MSSKKNTTPIPLQPLDELFGTAGDSANGICEVSVSSLHSFPNHPFKVNNDKKMEELVKSVTEYGVLVPGIVRMRSAGGYELVAGHRRRRACEIAGIQKMPVIIKDLTDDEATVIMVDSNIQREELLFSEKAFAYKMKYDALKRQGKRTDLTSCRVGKKSAAEEVSQNTDDSARQVLRYIHLTELITELLDLTDIKKLKEPQWFSNASSYQEFRRMRENGQIDILQLTGRQRLLFFTCLSGPTFEQKY